MRGRRAGPILRWIFLRTRGRQRRWRELGPGFLIILVVTAANTTCEREGLYERLEWADLDRLQRTAPATGAGGLTLVLIGDEEYETFFDATSPLDPLRLTDVLDAVCRFGPRIVGVDLLTADWPAGFYEGTAATRLGACPIVWLRDEGGHAYVNAEDLGRPVPRFTPGRVLGASAAPAGACTALGIFEPDADGVIRRYSRWYPAAPAGSDPSPTFVTALARDATSPGCEPAGSTLAALDAGPHRIRFTSHDSFPRLPVAHLLEAAADPTAPLRVLIQGRTVIVGGSYRHARDEHRTPVGLVHGSELIAHAVWTERSAPIPLVSSRQSFAIALLVSYALLLGITWAGLRWPWAVLASLLLSAAAALVIAWQVYRYLGYFLGVLGGLMGVVLAELALFMWPPLRTMWRDWLSEYPRQVDGAAGAAPAQAATAPTPDPSDSAPRAAAPPPQATSPQATAGSSGS